MRAAGKRTVEEVLSEEPRPAKKLKKPKQEKEEAPEDEEDEARRASVNAGGKRLRWVMLCVET